jgi:hypothetical protein
LHHRRLGFMRRRKSLLGRDGDEGIERRVRPLDASQNHLDKFNRRQFPAGDQRDELGSRSEGEIGH